MIDKVFNKSITKQSEFDEEVASVLMICLIGPVPFYKEMQRLSINFGHVIILMKMTKDIWFRMFYCIYR